MVRKCFLLFVIFIAVSCSSRKQIVTPLINNSQLRLDGYYYHKYDKWHAISFIYQNGIIKWHASTQISLDSINTYYLTEESINNAQRYKSNFAVINIDSQVIKIQSWNPGIRPRSIIRFGKVLTDTTFFIDKICQLNGFGKLINCEDKPYLYQFVPFSPKPDSTNPFIKSIIE